MEPTNAPRLWVKHHLPLITPRIEFCLADRPPLPLITPRIDFANYDFTRRARILDVTGNSSQGRPATPEARVHVQAATHARRQKTNEEKIQKPRGEPGRPGSGGFALEVALKDCGWEPEDIKDFINDVRTETRAKLDTSIGYRGQNSEVVREICALLSGPDRWPILADYADSWPVISAIKLQLKSKSEACRRKINQRVRTAALDDNDKEEDEVAAFLLDISSDPTVRSGYSE